MKNNERDAQVVEKIIEYCDEIIDTVTHFGNAAKIFQENKIFRNACALCVLQIGELSTHLSDAFKTKFSVIPWQRIKALRNIVAHAYGTMNVEMLWEIIATDIPLLKEKCEEILGKE